MNHPDELEDEIYAELENKLGRPATFEEYAKVAERIPSLADSQDIRRIVERLAVLEEIQP